MTVYGDGTNLNKYYSRSSLEPPLQGFPTWLALLQAWFFNRTERAGSPAANETAFLALLRSEGLAKGFVGEIFRRGKGLGNQSTYSSTNPIGLIGEWATLRSRSRQSTTPTRPHTSSFDGPSFWIINN
ncbi:hypothetical protein VTN77DRAFT_3259 [Rasamsonia byssochlamydoides]|uniref:uncharacterized protein n=1 Tax=Rasamsonia byssochlamydoides TaxID=89139 RepID=UPI0037439D89